MRTYFLWCVLAGCGFSGAGGDAGPDGMIGNDAPPPLSVDFLADSEVVFAETSWTINADTTIDTTTMAISPQPAEPVSLSGGKQKDDTMSLAVLRVKDLTLASGISLTVTGDWPLVILAGGEVRIDGLLDVGAHGGKAGPGGSTLETLDGAGARSVHGASRVDSGGGGGSFGTTGSAGGPSDAAMSAAGLVYSLSGRLVGGASGGGPPSTCANRAGAGGGALLLYAKTSIHLDGTINAGGGGGGGGLDTDCDGDDGAGPGAGGGSGGTIWLQTAQLDGNGTLAANGGGGGGGGHDFISADGRGENGEDGKPNANAAARGGNRGGASGTAGANGALEGIPATGVTPINAFDGNGGGGGGGLGRIVYRAPSLGDLQSSPTAARAPD